jgi:hypothetical protein
MLSIFCSLVVNGRMQKIIQVYAFVFKRLHKFEGSEFSHKLHDNMS